MRALLTSTAILAIALSGCANAPPTPPPTLASAELHAELGESAESGSVSLVAVVEWFAAELAARADVWVEWPYLGAELDALGIVTLTMAANVEADAICATLAIVGLEFVLADDENCEATALPAKD